MDQAGEQEIAVAVANRQRRIDCDGALLLERHQAAERALALTHRQHQVGADDRTVDQARGADGGGLDAMTLELGHHRVENCGVMLDLARRELGLAINPQRAHRQSPLPSNSPRIAAPATIARAAARSADSSTSIVVASSIAARRIPLATAIASSLRIASSRSARARGAKSKIAAGR